MSKWISVDDMLPEDYVPVCVAGGEICSVYGMDATVGQYIESLRYFECWVEGGLECAKATHWQPIPSFKVVK
ncbi:DUF551 domain-containing protein [Pseudoalteromonas marina]|uniref:DUF551 domain-containing protein n=1 Tax=Pseudoalteromonas marina TaxID=267375 RepID=UPI0023EF57BE|nr:DUF551 domain-containing protein [Pseudoalteromonas marina]